MDLKPQDLVISTYRAPGQTSRWMWSSYRGVRILHVPTGIQAECHEHESQHRNRVTAFDKLIEMVGQHIARNMIYAEAETKLVAGPGMMNERQIKWFVTRFFVMTHLSRKSVRGGEKPAVALHQLLNEVYAQAYRHGIRDSGVHGTSSGQPTHSGHYNAPLET